MGVAIMKSTKRRVEVVTLEPTPGLCLRNIHTNEVFESAIKLAESLTEDDFDEITQEEYDRIVQEQIDEYNAQFEQGGDQVEN